jgi:hypothetical protein
VTAPEVTRRALDGAHAVVIALSAISRATARSLGAIERDAVLR